MSKGYLGILTEALESIPEKDLVGSSLAVRSGETVIGELTDVGLRRLFQHSNRLKDSLRREMKKAKSLPDQEPHNPLTCSRCQAVIKLDIDGDLIKGLMEVFWAGLKAGLPNDVVTSMAGDDFGGVGIREGWKIVKMPPKNDDRLVGAALAAAVLAGRFD